ncbi:hypothetical protein IFR05_014019 [Cadophora sp. M221]|nr:hypothetical protein IFR05_014019 [Cadophora sp. M221]
MLVIYYLELASLGHSQTPTANENGGVSLAVMENKMSAQGNHGAVQMAGLNLARERTDMLCISISTSTSFKDGMNTTCFPVLNQVMPSSITANTHGRTQAANSSDGGDCEIQGLEESFISTTSNKDSTAT